MPPADAEAQFVGGLAALRLGQSDTATPFRHRLSRCLRLAMRAARAFWAGRVEQRAATAARSPSGCAALPWRAIRSTDDRPAGAGPRASLRAGRDSATPISRHCWRRRRAAEPSPSFRSAKSASPRRNCARCGPIPQPDGLFDRPILLVARAVGFAQLAAEIEQNGAAGPQMRDARRLRPRVGSSSIHRWSTRWSAMNRISSPRRFRAPARAG